MAFASGPSEVIRRVIGALENSGVPYMLTGSFASALYGTPRSTQDIDLVISPDGAGMNRLLDHFPEAQYYVSREAAFDALERGDLFNVIDLETSWKIDFIIRKNRPFSLTEFERRAQTNAFGFSFYVATAEDILLSKLEWAKLGESERQLRDAAGIIRTQGSNLDLQYIEKWVKGLDLEGQWKEAQEIAS